jgi:hypothetical protein
LIFTSFTPPIKKLFRSKIFSLAARRGINLRLQKKSLFLRSKFPKTLTENNRSGVAAAII